MILLWILAIKEHSRVKLFLFEDILEKCDKPIILDEYYDSSSLFSQADDLGDYLQANIFELLHIILVVGCLVVEYDIFLSYLL
jgi:hypothetical protein